MSRLISLRATLTVVTVLAHLAGVSHMAFVAHTLSSAGAVVEVDFHAPVQRGHHHEAGSICERSDAPEATWTTPESCEAAAWSRVSARPVHPPALHADPRRAVVSRELRTHETAWTQPPLVVAPKSSPPHVG
ncbi:MAG: hypothetical protein AB1730_27915 [Myxococcota bacterium]